MRPSKTTLFLFVFFIFVTCVVQSEAVVNEGVVSGGGAGSNSVTVVDVSFLEFESLSLRLSIS